MRAQAWALHTITCVNSLGTGVLWNGLSFLVEREYAYTRQETLALYVGTALAYAVAAWWTGSLLRRLGNHVSPRAFLGWIFVAQGLAAPLVLIPGSSIGLVVAATVLSVAGAMMWPVVEAYVSSGKDGHAMRRSAGLAPASDGRTACRLRDSAGRAARNRSVAPDKHMHPMIARSRRTSAALFMNAQSRRKA